MSSDGGFRLGCDVGGTFTDFVLYDEASGQIHIDKQLTTPADPSVGIPRGLRRFGSIAGNHVARTNLVAHATTLIANAVIERKGARTALPTARGFRDVPEPCRHVRVTTYAPWSDPPRPVNCPINRTRAMSSPTNRWFRPDRRGACDSRRGARWAAAMVRSARSRSLAARSIRPARRK